MGKWRDDWKTTEYDRTFNNSGPRTDIFTWKFSSLADIFSHIFQSTHHEAKHDVVAMGSAGDEELLRPDFDFINQTMWRYTLDDASEKMSVSHIEYVWGHGARKRKRVDMDTSAVDAFFAGTTSGADERERIRTAHASVEAVCAEATHTTGDQPGVSWRSHQQLDCVDEVVNALRIMLFFWKRGLFQYHHIHGPIWKQRGVLPHYGLAIDDITEGFRYVIDTGVDNPGGEISIVDVRHWR